MENACIQGNIHPPPVFTGVAPGAMIGTSGDRKKKLGSGFVVTYVQSCASGVLGSSECGPIWQLAVIGVLLVSAVFTLLVLRLRSRPA
jgi:hypothetical protein